MHWDRSNGRECHPHGRDYSKKEQRLNKISWLKKGTDVLKLWYWWRLLRVPWTARRSNQSILEEINPESSLEGLMLKWSSNTLATCAKSQLIWKDPDAGKGWRQEEKGTTEDEMVGWPHWLNGHEFEQTPGDGEGQGSLACCSPRGCRVRPDWMTEPKWEKGISSHTAQPQSTCWQPAAGPGRKIFPALLYHSSLPTPQAQRGHSTSFTKEEAES